MKKLNGLLSMFFLIALYLFGCTTDAEYEMSALPVVKKTSVNYNDSTFNKTFPDTTSWYDMKRAYANESYYIFEDELLNYMRNKVLWMGEDLSVFEEILTRTYCKDNEAYVLPVYAERARYKNQEAWIIQLALGFGNPSFGHYQCLAFSIPNLDTMAYDACR